MTDILSDEKKRELCRIIAANLPTLRKKAKISQADMAAKLGISRRTVSMIENGTWKMQWCTASLLIIFFSKNDEIRNLMIAMGLIDDEVEKTLSIDI